MILSRVIEHVKQQHWTAVSLDFVIVVLGGLGSVPGAVIAGVLLGVVENLVSGLWDAGYSEVVSFGLLVLVLVARPRGLAGDRYLEAR